MAALRTATLPLWTSLTRRCNGGSSPGPCRRLALRFACGDVSRCPIWVWVKIKAPGDRRFWSMFPLTRVRFWAPIFDHSHVPQNWDASKMTLSFGHKGVPKQEGTFIVSFAAGAIITFWLTLLEEIPRRVIFRGDYGEPWFRTKEHVWPELVVFCKERSLVQKDGWFPGCFPRAPILKRGEAFNSNPVASCKTCSLDQLGLVWRSCPSLGGS